MKIKLNRNINITIIFILLILLSAGINLAFSQNIFMPVSEIKPGMKGIGKTVFHGTQIETFQVDIIDIVKGEDDINHFILANLNGDKIEEGGGISAGMSGSPVYIDDRLIGAVSYAWEMSEHNLCLVTPIQEMLEIFNLPYNNSHITSIGTVTYREGNKILALGHPFLKKGKSSFLLSEMYIYHSFPNKVMPFKLGSPLNLVGKVVQDREAGILAILNSYPPVIPLKIQVTDINSGLSYQMGVQMINDYDLLEPLVSNITVQAIDNALDRIGAGTAQIDIEIKGKKEGQELFRKNMYYSSDDIAIQAITEIPEIIDLIVNNYFEMVNLNKVNIDIEIDTKKKICRVEEVVLENSSIKPGD